MFFVTTGGIEQVETVTSALQMEKSRPGLKKSAKKYTKIQGRMGISSFCLPFLCLFFLTKLLFVL